MEFKEYSDYFIIPETVDIVFRGLIQEDTIQLWSGASAEMQLSGEGAFSLWDETIVGHNVEIIEEEKIVQQWYFGQADETHPSLVQLALFPHKKGTSIHVKHTNIPADVYENIVSGWQNTYMRSLIQFYK
jgi:activator of HSP90 ATPase